MIYEWQREPYTISTDPARLDLNLIHSFLTTSYWAAGVPMEIVRRSIEHSLPFGLYEGDRQIGFARVITVYATYAYLADVFVLEASRGAGLGKWLVAVIAAHPDLRGLRRWMLATRDAHGLYRTVGFELLKAPERWMEKHTPDIYSKAAPDEQDAGE